jgi:hypothetical protein
VLCRKRGPTRNITQKAFLLRAPEHEEPVVERPQDRHDGLGHHGSRHEALQPCGRVSANHAQTINAWMVG